jgi:hypothetical protein
VIVYSLKCENSHEFEDWFSSSAAFDEQAAKGKLVCPECSSHKIEKAPMAPAVSSAQRNKSVPAGCPMAAASEAPPCAGGCGCFPG